MMNKSGFTMPSWMLGVLLAILVLGIFLFFIFVPYKENLGNFVQTNIIGNLGN